MVLKELWQQVISVVEKLWDPGPVNAVQEFFGPAWSPLFGAVTLLGTVYAVAVVVSWALWFARRRLAYFLLGAVVLAAATNTLLWTLFSVPRPDDPEIVVREQLSVPSFPSGHTVTAAVLWGSLAASGRVPRVVPFLVVPVVMLSRLYLGAHYLGDVLVSALIGAFLVAVYLYVGPTIARWFDKMPFWLFLVIGLCAPFALLLFMGPSPRGFELFSVALAAGIGLPLERRYVRSKLAEAPTRGRALKAAVGLGGMGLLLLAYGLLGAAYPVLNYALLALAVLWGVLLAPALFASEGPATRPDRGGET
jgi:membrane-associated phospholipid phosphatase